MPDDGSSSRWPLETGENKIVKVLIVEDNDADFVALQRSLFSIVQHDFDVQQVHTLQRAKSLLRHKDYDVVFLDLSLPDGTGLETVSELLKDRPDMNIVVVTGLEGRTLSEDALALGARELLAKATLSPNTVSKSLRRVLRAAK